MLRTLLMVLSAALAAGLGLAPAARGQGPNRPAADAEAPPRGFGPPAAGQGGRFRFPSPPLVDALDADDDGDLSSAELDAAPTSIRALDKNQDQQVNDAELTPVFPGGPGFGRGGPMGGMMGGERKLVAQFDANGDGRLDLEERNQARAAQVGPQGFGGPPGFGGPGGPGGGPRGFGPFGGREPAEQGERLAPDDVPHYLDRELYDPAVLRTLFLEFESPDWETELAAFKGSDVEVPATLTVDGHVYPQVGVHFRGASSYMMVPATYKRSLNVSLDFVNLQQRLYGYKTLNLLNANGDSSLLSSALYSHIARKHIPAPRANMVRVVINGEDWGVYANVQQFDRIFLAEHSGNDQGVRWKVPAENYGSDEVARWKVPGSPGGGGGLEYLGEEIEPYKRRYELKSKDNEQAWRDLVKLCRTLNETPPDELEAALGALVDMDELLWFLAIDVAVCNSDGYWVRSSDFSMFQDADGVFHFIPHDMNEAFQTGGGPGGPMRGRRGQNAPGEAQPAPPTAPAGDVPDRGFGPPGVFADDPFGPGEGRPSRDGGGPFGPGGFGPPGFGGGGFGPPGFGHGGVELDPLVALNDPRMPLRSKLLVVPALRARYLEFVRAIADDLDWATLGPVVAQYRELLEPVVKTDAKLLSTFEAFTAATADAPAGDDGGRSLRQFADGRRAYLLSYSPDETLAAAGDRSGQAPADRGGDQRGPRIFRMPVLALMKALDADGDAALSNEEIERSTAALKSLDKNEDSVLSPEESGWPPVGFGRGGGFGPGPGGFFGGPPLDAAGDGNGRQVP